MSSISVPASGTEVVAKNHRINADPRQAPFPSPCVSFHIVSFHIFGHSKQIPLHATLFTNYRDVHIELLKTRQTYDPRYIRSGTVELHCDHLIVVSNATGVPAERYARFARWLCAASEDDQNFDDRRIAVLTWDFSGVGESLPHPYRPVVKDGRTESKEQASLEHQFDARSAAELRQQKMAGAVASAAVTQTDWATDLNCVLKWTVRAARKRGVRRLAGTVAGNEESGGGNLGGMDGTERVGVGGPRPMEISHIGHSVGGHIFPLADLTSQVVLRAVNVSCQSAWVGYSRSRFFGTRAGNEGFVDKKVIKKEEDHETVRAISTSITAPPSRPPTAAASASISTPTAASDDAPAARPSPSSVPRFRAGYSSASYEFLLFQWRVFLPLVLRYYGYFPARRFFGMASEFLPAGVLRNWGEWSLAPGYLVDATRYPHFRRQYRNFLGEVLCLFGLEDEFMRVGVEAVRRYCQSLPLPGVQLQSSSAEGGGAAVQILDVPRHVVPPEIADINCQLGADVGCTARVRVIAPSAGVAESKKRPMIRHNSWLTDPAVAQVVWPEMRRFCLGLGVVEMRGGKSDHGTRHHDEGSKVRSVERTSIGARKRDREMLGKAKL